MNHSVVMLLVLQHCPPSFCQDLRTKKNVTNCNDANAHGATPLTHLHRASASVLRRSGKHLL